MSLWIEWNIQFTWKFAWMLRTYRTCNSTIGFSKYEFYNKLLGGVTLLIITPNVTWTQPIYIYIYTHTHTHIHTYAHASAICETWIFFLHLFIYYLKGTIPLENIIGMLITE